MPLVNPTWKFNPLLLPGVWRYVSAYTQWDDGRPNTYNFTETPKGVFIIRPTGVYSHIVMSPDLDPVASGQLKVMTDAEAKDIATNVLAHFGSWTADPVEGSFTLQIEKSSFPNFDGITQVRTITKLTARELQYINHQVSNGAGAVVVAKLERDLGGLGD